MSVKIQEVVIDLAHIRLAGLRFGEGKHTVLALHGWLDNAMSFAPLAEVLVEKDYSILALEFAGHGHSGHRPLGSGYHFTDYIMDVMMAADMLGLERMDLLCHSMGATIAPMIAGAFPERVARMVCIELYGVGVISDHDPIPQRIRDRLYQLDYMCSRPEKVYSNLETLIRVRRQAGDMYPENAKRLLLRNMIATAGGYRFLSDRRLRWWQPMTFSQEQMLSFHRRITAPVLIIEGKEGVTGQWDFLAERYAATDDLCLLRLSGGHHLHMDHPEMVAEEVRKFWKEHPFL